MCCAVWCGVVWWGVLVVWFAAALVRVMVTPAFYSRVFEFLTTLTFGALRKKKKSSVNSI